MCSQGHAGYWSDCILVIFEAGVYFKYILNVSAVNDCNAFLIVMQYVYLLFLRVKPKTQWKKFLNFSSSSCRKSESVSAQGFPQILLFLLMKLLEAVQQTVGCKFGSRCRTSVCPRTNFTMGKLVKFSNHHNLSFVALLNVCCPERLFLRMHHFSGFPIRCEDILLDNTSI